MTRLYIHADSGKQPRFFLPWNYNLSFQSFVYDAIGEYEPELATELHQLKHAPPFTFSNFIQTGPYTPYEDGLSCTRGYWVINSDNDAIINALANYAENYELRLGHTDVPVVSTEVENVEGESGEIEYTTVSPVAVGEMPYDGDGTREWYERGDDMWVTRMRESVVDRMEHRLDINSSEIKFRMNNIKNSDKKVKIVKDDIKIPCTRFKFSAKVDSMTDRFLRVQGLGEKTGQGFGTIMQDKEIPARWS